MGFIYVYEYEDTKYGKCTSASVSKLFAECLYLRRISAIHNRPDDKRARKRIWKRVQIEIFMRTRVQDIVQSLSLARPSSVVHPIVSSWSANNYTSMALVYSYWTAIKDCEACRNLLGSANNFVSAD